MAMTDIMTGLTTGMLDALPTPPLAAMAFQWYKQTPFMLDIGLTPIVGATVINKKTWEAISAADRAKISEIADAVDAKLRADVPKQDSLAVMLMSNQGLKVTKAGGAEWTAQGELLAKAMRGQMVPPDVFDMAVKERDAFRQRKAAAAPK
jgi:TRAP-type C4-dicarboxylate transport system substrate-binding protein